MCTWHVSIYDTWLNHLDTNEAGMDAEESITRMDGREDDEQIQKVICHHKGVAMEKKVQKKKSESFELAASLKHFKKRMCNSAKEWTEFVKKIDEFLKTGFELFISVELSRYH